MAMFGDTASLRYNAKIRAIPMPARVSRLPVSPTGFPVPWFVAWIDGVPDFRVIEQGKLAFAHDKKRCWVCGEAIGRNVAMLLGPMCAINRTIAEPPSHRDCAIYSAKACPFLSNPNMRRNEWHLPESRVDAAGFGLSRNPGAVCVWVTRSYRPFKVGDGVLFTFDDPIEVLWLAEGRIATRAEVMRSIDSGIPVLRAIAEEEGPGAVAELERFIKRAEPYFPKE